MISPIAFGRMPVIRARSNMVKRERISWAWRNAARRRFSTPTRCAPARGRGETRRGSVSGRIRCPPRLSRPRLSINSRGSFSGHAPSGKDVPARYPMRFPLIESPAPLRSAPFFPHIVFPLLGKAAPRSRGGFFAWEERSVAIQERETADKELSRGLFRLPPACREGHGIGRLKNSSYRAYGR